MHHKGNLFGKIFRARIGFPLEKMNSYACISVTSLDNFLFSRTKLKNYWSGYSNKYGSDDLNHPNHIDQPIRKNFSTPIS